MVFPAVFVIYVIFKSISDNNEAVVTTSAAVPPRVDAVNFLFVPSYATLVIAESRTLLSSAVIY